MPRKSLFGSLTDEGLASHKPASQRKWSKLTNVVRKDGALQPRPGIVEAAILLPGAFPADEPAPIVGIAEVLNPGASTARSGSTFESQALRPDGSSDVVAGWTGSHTDIDEVVPDGTGMTSSTPTAKKQIEFASPGTSFDFNQGLILRGRARIDVEGGKVSLRFYRRSGGSDKETIGTVVISATVFGESDEWQDFSFPMGEFSDAPIGSTMDIGMEYLDGSETLLEFLQPDGDGETDWLDATAGGAATFSDFSARAVEYPPGTPQNGATSNVAGDRQSWTLTGLTNSPSSISSITVFLWFGKARAARPTVEIFYNDGSDFVLDTVTLAPDRGIQQVTVSVAQNPSTSAAWTTADLEGSNVFGVELGAGGALDLRSAQVLVEYDLSSNPEVEVDYLAIDSVGWTGSSQSLIPDREAIWVTAHGRYRLDFLDAPTDVGGTTGSLSTGPRPLDHALLYGQLYFVNGVEPTLRYPNASNVFESLSTNNGTSAAAITGRCVMALGNRILYGWTKDGTSITPERISYSKVFDGGTHNHPSAGDFDLIGTPGGVLAMQQLSEGVGTALKERGVYRIRVTGDARAPFDPDLIDPRTGILAPATLVTSSDSAGNAFQLWLGESESHGINVYLYNGESVVPVGAGIHAELRDDLTYHAVSQAFGWIDAEGRYWLAVPESGKFLPEAGFVLDLFGAEPGAPNPFWTRFELPWSISAAGRWTMPRDHADAAASGEQVAILGHHSFIPFRLDDRYVHDTDLGTMEDSDVGSAPTLVFDASELGRKRNFIEATLETGDFAPEDPTSQTLVDSVQATVRDHGPARLRIDQSIDGGATFNTAVEYYLGSNSADGRLAFHRLDMQQAVEHRLRTRMRLGVENQPGDSDQKWEIEELWINYEKTGEGP